MKYMDFSRNTIEFLFLNLNRDFEYENPNIFDNEQNFLMCISSCRGIVKYSNNCVRFRTLKVLCMRIQIM